MHVSATPAGRKPSTNTLQHCTHAKQRSGAQAHRHKRLVGVAALGLRLFGSPLRFLCFQLLVCLLPRHGLGHPVITLQAAAAVASARRAAAALAVAAAVARVLPLLAAAAAPADCAAAIAAAATTAAVGRVVPPLVLGALLLWKQDGVGVQWAAAVVAAAAKAAAVAAAAGSGGGGVD